MNAWKRRGLKRAGKPWSSAFFNRVGQTAAVLLVVLLAGGGRLIAEQIRLGFHGGLCIPNIRGGTTEQSKGYVSRLGPFFGVFADFALSSNLSLCTEMNYASQGGKRNGMQPVSMAELPGVPLYADFHNETILDYLEIPLMLKLTWGQRPRFFAQAGPYVGFRLRARTVTSGSSLLYIDPSGIPLDSQLISFEGDTCICNDIHRINAGIAGGVGLEAPFGSGDLVLDLRFSIGLTNIQSDPELNGKNRTGAMIVSLGYCFALKGQ
jgi:hypothetical protein